MAFAMLIPVALSSWFSMNELKKRLILQHQVYQESLLQLSMNGIMLFMNQHHPEEIHNSLKGLQNQTTIKSIRILSNQGKISFSSHVQEEGTQLPVSELKEWSTDVTRKKVFENIDYPNNIMTLVTRIPKQNRCYACHSDPSPFIGYLSIVDDISNVNEELNIHTRNDIILASGIIFALVITVFLIHLRFVQRNLKLMGQAITEVEKGNFKTLIPVDDSEEIGSLVLSFNQMIERLNDMRKELHIAHLKELERADKLASVGQLAASMAHEIKNPVAGISCAMQVLKEDPEQNEQNVLIFEEISRQLKRIDHAVNSLLAYARPREPRMTATTIENLLKLTTNLVIQQAKLANVTVNLKIASDIPNLEVDIEQVEQVLVNLCMNGIQAMPTGGVLNIDANYHAETQQIFISVNDTGVGIEKELLEQIFKPFYTSKHKGTGLGLSICRSIIKSHGGDILVDSKIGTGSTFTVVLPRFAQISEDNSEEYLSPDAHTNSDSRGI